MPGTITATLLGQIRDTIEDTDTVPLHDDDEIYGDMTDAQKEIAGLLHSNYLTEFEIIIEAQAIDGTGINLATLNTNTGVLKGKAGIRKVKFSVDGVTFYWATELIDSEEKEMENTLKAVTNAQPRWFVDQNKLYIKSATMPGTSVVNIHCLTPPTDISATVDPTLNSMFYPLLKMISAAKAFLAEEKGSRSSALLEQAYAQIKNWNAQIEPQRK